MPLVQIKDFIVLTDNKTFYDQPVKSKQEAYERLIESSKNGDCTTGNLLDFSYHQNYCKFIGIDLSRQTNTIISHQINFTGKLEEDDGTTMFFLLLKSSKKQF